MSETTEGMPQFKHVHRDLAWLDERMALVDCMSLHELVAEARDLYEHPIVPECIGYDLAVAIVVRLAFVPLPREP